MTLLSRRKRRTTVRLITPGTAGAKAALFLALVAGPALAQPPGTQPQAQPSNTQPGALPLPPGYRPRTPPPQAQPQPARPAPGATPGSAGTVMYFQKAADALTATGGGLPSATENLGVAQLKDKEPARGSAIPDVPAVPSLNLPPPERTFAPPVQPSTVPTGFAAQPGPKGGGFLPEKKVGNPIPPVDPREIQLPSRDKIFTVYNDPELERAIMFQTIRDRIAITEKQIREEKDPGEIQKQERTLQELKAIKEPKDSGYQFPPLPVISSPGVAYQPKTAAYAPHTMYLEPGYVVHRRLHFEERNAERQGWDLGPLSTLVSAGTFYRNVLLWPQSLVSGCRTGFWDTSAGKCLPGSPSPYYLYPPGLTLTGTVAEAGIITGAAFLFP
ncbi:hypothetical protein [Gemmata sp. SH-PL17]|uniref:hypothetical protein n=1 Tax=Gemmata sp. SH-PL17 TaxID=1630693 RepID=UPI0012FBB5EB|nr:hypothetical protein [Gemmata sp. SH-PL17]